MKKLPISDDGEQGLLGSMLLDPEKIGKISYIRSEYFYHPKHQKLYKSLIEMYVNNMTIDTLLVRQYLIEKDRLEQVGGEEYLMHLMDSTIVASHSQHYAKKIEQAYNLRKDISILEKGLNSLYNWEDGAADQVISNLTCDQLEDNKELPLDKMAEKWVDDSHSGACGKFPWWCESWDKKLGMVDRGSTAPLMLLVSPRSTGKTALSLNWLRRLHEKGLKIAYSSIEMQTQELVPRLISSYGIDTWNMSTRGYCTKDELEKSAKAIKEIKNLNLIIKDKSQSIDDIRSFCISQSRKGQLDGLIVDNLLTINPGTKDYVNRTIFYDYCISRFKELRDELNVPILILCHPTGDKVANSQNCENIADVILFLHNVPANGLDVNGVTIHNDYDVPGQHCIIKFSKNRQGLSPVSHCSFMKPYQTFNHIKWEDGID